jgi:hypothetical protein
VQKGGMGAEAAVPIVRDFLTTLRHAPSGRPAGPVAGGG